MDNSKKDTFTMLFQSKECKPIFYCSIVFERLLKKSHYNVKFFKRSVVISSQLKSVLINPKVEEKAVILKHCVLEGWKMTRG